MRRPSGWFEAAAPLPRRKATVKTNPHPRKAGSMKPDSSMTQAGMIARPGAPLRGAARAPDRSEIEPGAIRQALSDTFILELDAADGHSFRLAGTRVCALFGRELKGESFIDLWDLGSRGPIADLLAISSDESVGTVAGVTAHSTTGEPLELELLLLPLGMRRPRLARTIGVLAPLKPPAWLGVSPIEALTLGSRRHVGAMAKTRLLPRFMAPRRGLVVHQGGRS